MASELRARIQRGSYLQGAWLPTERELAAEFGVARAVVRAAIDALSDEGRVVRETGRRPWVADRCEPALGRSSAQGLRYIAAILPQHSSFPSSLALLRGINLALRAESAPLVTVAFDNYGHSPHVEEELAALRWARSDDCAGVVLWPMDARETLPQVAAVRDAGTPVVFVDRFAPGWDADFVGVENRMAARQVVQHLLALGHARVAFIGGDEIVFTTTTRDRLRGYQEALKECGLADPALIYLMNPIERPASKAIDTLLSLKRPPTAIFANNDAIAYWVLRDLESQGIRVPQDVSLVGFDDADRFALSPARLTSIHQPFEEMGQRAAELVLERLQAGERASAPWQHLLLPAPLVVRETTGPASARIC